MELSPVGVPVVWEGKVINYVFVSVRLRLSPRADAARLRDKAPFFRDALVRVTHRQSFVKPYDFTHVDRAALAEAMLKESQRIAGPGAVTQVEITQETPQRRSGLPQRPTPQKPQDAAIR